jgi:hypothetical protein
MVAFAECNLNPGGFERDQYFNDFFKFRVDLVILAEPEIKEITGNEKLIGAGLTQAVQEANQVPVTGIAATFQVRIR